MGETRVLWELSIGIAYRWPTLGRIMPLWELAEAGHHSTYYDTPLETETSRLQYIKASQHFDIDNN